MSKKTKEEKYVESEDEAIGKEVEEFSISGYINKTNIGNYSEYKHFHKFLLKNATEEAKFFVMIQKKCNGKKTREFYINDELVKN